MPHATQDLTHAEASEAFKALQVEIGSVPYVSISLNICSWDSQTHALHAAIYPRGIGYGEAIRVNASSYTDLLAAIRAAWAEQTDERSAKAIRDMALKIISITADEGVCSEFSLARAFSAAEVRTYGDRACEEATRIAGNGPFSIVRAASESEAA